MIIKIDSNEKDAVKKCCAELGFTCDFYTIENNVHMLQAEILWPGRLELKPEFGFSLGRIITYELERRISDQKLNAL